MSALPREFEVVPAAEIEEIWEANSMKYHEEWEGIEDLYYYEAQPQIEVWL